MEVNGKLIFKGEVQSFGDNGFTKREFAVETKEEYPQKIGLELVKDKCSLLDEFEIGDTLNVSVNLRGRDWTNPKGDVKYFNSLQAWKIIKDGSVGSTTKEQNKPDDDLPF